MVKGMLEKYKLSFNKKLDVKSNIEEAKNGLSFNDGGNFKKRKHNGLLACILAAVVILGVVAGLTTFGVIGYMNTPVYKGMSVVDNKLNHEVATLSNHISDSVIEDSIEEDLPEVIVDNSISAYAKKGSTIRVMVELSNPKAFEILSFTLNGYKYQSFEFKEGSSSTSLYVDIKASEVSGIEELTIDELKYVDGSKIKSARYDGNKTIKIGITYDNVPGNEVLSREIGASSYSVALKGNDLDNLIKPDGFYKYYLFDDSRLLESGEIENSLFSYKIETLPMNSSYTFIMCCTIDLLDGKGMRTIYTYDDEFNTKPGLTEIESQEAIDNISVSLTKANGVSIVGSRLFIGKELYKENTGSEVSFKDIYSNTLYYCEVDYTYSLKGIEYKDTIGFEVKSLECNVPTINGNAIVFSNKLMLDYNTMDGSSIKEIRIDVYLDDMYYISTDDLKALIVLDGKPHKEIRLELELSYDLNDRAGVKTVTYSRLAGV